MTEDIETRFHTTNSKLDNSLPKERKNKKVIGLMKNKLGGKVITKSVGLRGITNSYLINGGSEDNKAKGTKQCII